MARDTHFKGSVNLKFNAIAGGAAGNHTLTGISTEDSLLGIAHVTIDTDGTVADTTDILSEFSITSDDTLNNAGGTGTTDDLLLILWQDVDA